LPYAALPRSRDDHRPAHVVAVQRALVVVRAALREPDREAVATPDLVVVLPLDLDGVGEVVVVRPGDGAAGLDPNHVRVEAVALRHRDVVGGHGRPMAACAAAARCEGGRGEGCGGREEQAGESHEDVTPSAGLRTTDVTAPANTSTNAARSSTSAIVCANRNTVQSRW